MNDTTLYNVPSGTASNGQTIYRSGVSSAVPQAMPAPTAPATPAPTISSLYGSVSPDDKAIMDSTSYYRDLAQTPVDEQGIRDATTKRLQAEIDATNEVYNQKLNQAKIAGESNLGSNAAMSARRGLLGSDFGNALNQDVVTKNDATYSAIDAERAAAIAAINDKGTAAANQEIATKNAAKQLGAQDYISFLSTQEQRRTQRTTDAAKALVASGHDFSDPSEFKAIADSYQISPLALQSAYVDAKNAALSAKAALVKPVAGAVGAPSWQFNPETGSFEKMAGSGASDLVSQAINDGRLDPSQVTRYNIQVINDTLNSDPTHDFVTGKQTLLNSTSYTKDAYGNIVSLKKFPNVPTAGALSSVTKSGSGGSGGGSVGGGVTTFPKADAASLQQQQLYADSTQRAFNTANQNLNALVQFMKTAGVNGGSTVPLINDLTNKVKAGALDPGTIAGYRAAIAGLRAEYAQVLSRGGEVTEGQRAQAASLIPDNLTPAQLQQVADRLNIEGTNAVSEANAQIQVIKDRVNGKVTLPGASSAAISKGSMSNADFVQKALSSSGLNYQTVLSQIPAGKKGVIDNATGQVGSIDPNEFDPSLYTPL